MRFEPETEIMMSIWCITNNGSSTTVKGIYARLSARYSINVSELFCNEKISNVSAMPI